MHLSSFIQSAVLYDRLLLFYIDLHSPSKSVMISDLLNLQSFLSQLSFSLVFYNLYFIFKYSYCYSFLLIKCPIQFFPLLSSPKLFSSPLLTCFNTFLLAIQTAHLTKSILLYTQISKPSIFKPKFHVSQLFSSTLHT